VQRIENANARFELGYWAIRGLAQPIRFLLAHAMVEISEVRFGINQDGSLIEDESPDWQDHKDALSLPFANLPYLIDLERPDEIRLTQSNAIMRFLARRFDYYGDSVIEQTWIDLLQDEAYDFRNLIVETAYTLDPDYGQAFEEFKSTSAPRYLNGFEYHLSNRKLQSCFVGSRISLVDFILYELIWQVRLMVPGSITVINRPTLHSFLESFEKISQITAYMAGDDYIDRPINSPWASFC
jgi:glutathione S-transferase